MTSLSTATPTTADDLREQVRARYAEAARAVASGQQASCCDDTCCGEVAPAAADEKAPAPNPTEASGAEASGTEASSAAADATQPCCESTCCSGDAATKDFGESLYSDEQRGQLPDAAALASLGCGNPTAVAELREGETVLDLGSGGGIDVILSAQRVGPTGTVYGLDMTDEMLALARANVEEVAATNVHLLKGVIEQIPLPAASVDVVISNCVINLSVDKAAVIAEIARVLKPGGRIGISDVVAEDQLSADERAQRGSYVGCIAGALSRSEYLAGLEAAGLSDVTVVFTHAVADGMHGAIVRASRPG